MSTILKFLSAVRGFWVFNGGLAKKRTHLRHEMSAYIRKTAPSVRRTAFNVRKKAPVVSETAGKVSQLGFRRIYKGFFNHEGRE